MNDHLQNDILAEIDHIACDEKLYHEKNFSLRSQAIDYLEFHIIDRLNAITDTAGHHSNLKQYATEVLRSLEDGDRKMFHKLRSKISLGDYKGKLLLELVDEHLDLNTFFQQDETGYDEFDLFVNGILSHHDMPAETKRRQPGMVYYQKTPARIILELIKKARFKQDDVFFDIGSGLGQVAILVHLLTSVASKGIEYEPAFCSYANARTADLNLTGVEFINTDARDADYAEGTVFFMYTPCEGEMLLDVLQRLHTESKTRQIKIFSYGPCTAFVAQQYWLTKEFDVGERDEFAGFVSV